jgi:hypothetical protein
MSCGNTSPTRRCGRSGATSSQAKASTGRATSSSASAWAKSSSSPGSTSTDNELARSDSQWERRTAIYSTGFFIRNGDLDDTFAIAEVLLGDEEDLIHKAVGGWLREAGKHDRSRLLRFLDEHAAEMPRTMLRYAIEHLDEEQRAHCRSV